MRANSLLQITMVICLYTSQTSVRALNAVFFTLKSNQNFANENQHGLNKLANPCAKVTCTRPHSRCRIENGRAVCSCFQICDLLYAPVCDSDGRTYMNECFMRFISCKAKKNISVSSRGSCPATPCNFFHCRRPYSTCKVVSGDPVCQCRQSCPKTAHFPVCGSDRKNYRNTCLLQKASCTSDTNIYIFRFGRCPRNCRRIFCRKPYSQCKVNGGWAACQCPQTCPANIRLVCGSDHKTYNNECSLRKASCNSNKRIFVSHHGRCPTNPCANVTCTRPHSRCRVENGRAVCSCFQACDFLYAPVCDSDGRTYKNECFMQFISCKANKNISVFSRGRCPREIFQGHPILQPIANTTVFQGQSATLNCLAVSDAKSMPHFRWLKCFSKPTNNSGNFSKTLKDHDHCEHIRQKGYRYRPSNSRLYNRFIYRSINGYIASYGMQLIMINVTKKDEGRYACSVGNRVGRDITYTYVIVRDISSLGQKHVGEIDIGFAISAAAMDAVDTFDKIKDSVKAIVDIYGTGDIRYGIILFGSNSTISKVFGTYEDDRAFKQAVVSFQRPTGEPNLEKALRKAKTMFDASRDRPDAKKVLVVIMDKNSSNSLDELKKAALSLEESKVKVVLVAIGRVADTKLLTAITSNPVNLLEVKKAESANIIGKKIMDKALTAVHYGWSQWSKWGACSSTCGNGTQLSRRRCSSHFKIPCEQVRSQLCWSPCPGSVSLTCPEEIRVLNITVKELVDKSWSITPNISHNSSDVKLNMTVTHSDLNFSKILEIQLHRLLLPKIVLKGEWNGFGIKYAKGNVTTANEQGDPQSTVPVICTVPTSSTPYSIEFSVRNAFTQRTACNFYVTVHATDKRRHQQDSVKSKVPVLLICSVILALFVCLAIGFAVLKLKSRLLTNNSNACSLPEKSVSTTEYSSASTYYEDSDSWPCFVTTLAQQSYERENGHQSRPKAFGTWKNETWDPETTNTSVSTSQKNFYYPCGSHLRQDDHHWSSVNLSTIPETATEGVFTDDGTLSECSALNNAICSAPLTPRTRNKSVHSQKSAVSFGPSERSSITFNPCIDLPSSADPRYCDYGLVDYRGGRLTIENMDSSMFIPQFAMPESKGKVIGIALQKAEGDQPPLEDNETLLSPIVVCWPYEMQFQKSVFVTIPHCADMTGDGIWDMEVKYSQGESCEKLEWKTGASSTESGQYDAFCQIESRECTLIINHFSKFCVVGRPRNVAAQRGNANGKSTKTKGKEQPGKNETQSEGATGGKKPQKSAEEPKGDERDQDERKPRRNPGEEQKEIEEGNVFRAIVAYSSPPCVDKDLAVRVYCIKQLRASLQFLDDLEKERYNGESSDTSYEVLTFEGTGEDLKIKAIGVLEGWELSKWTKPEEEIPYDIVRQGLTKDSLPPNIHFLYSRVDTNVYQFTSHYEARQDKPGAKTVRLHVNSSIKSRSSSSSGYCSIKPAEPIRYPFPLAVRQQLCYKLDPIEDVISDWRHVAEKAGCGKDITKWWQSGNGDGTSPTDNLIDWCEKKEIPLIKLKQYLYALGRDDCVEIIVASQSTEL